MSDITQSATDSEVVFSPSTNTADVWMRDNYNLTEGIRLIFELPDESDLAKSFRDNASAAGFTISSFP